MITIQQIKQDINSGKSKMIYYSCHTLWWTHLDEDVLAAREVGIKTQSEAHERFMQRPDVPRSEKQKMAAVYKAMQASPLSIPVDPTGSPLYQTDRPMEFILMSEKKSAHFGKHGIDAFMKSHHQNCGGLCFSSWDKYNELLEIN